jgi:hypothetical protein
MPDAHAATAIAGQIGRFTPLPATHPYPGWDGVKDRRLVDDPCPGAISVGDVNAWVNAHVTYLLDPAHWQRPIETLLLRTGDCKDFAVLKRAILLAKGAYADAELMLVVGQDQVMRQLHAVLWTPAGIMDELTDPLLGPGQLLQVFTPELAFTGTGAFVYAETPR